VQGTITEVKNVAYQHLSTQIQDSIAHAQTAGLQFQLFVRESTVLSAPLMDQVRAGFIRIGIIPPKGP
jgi:Restriction endonuclease fold toxin 7